MSREAPRIPFIEGLRGIAAFVVCAGHFIKVWPAYFDSNHDITHASVRELAAWAVWPNNEMVELFMVISAFSLAYSEIRRREAGRTPTSLARFAKRRLWRIGPTYYVAFLAGVIVVALIPAAAIHAFVATRTSQPLTLPGTVAHVAFLQNMSAQWLSQGSTPLWSMAYEAQLYVLFPLLFLAIRRINPWLVVTPALILVLVLEHGLDTAIAYRFSLLFCFLLGIALAGLYRRVDWIATWAALTAGLSLLALGYMRLESLHGTVTHDVVWGGAFAFLILAMTRAPEARLNPANWKAVRRLGAYSYSLYAMHWPVLLILVDISYQDRLHSDAWVVAMFAIGVTASLLLARLVFRLVERPSLDRVRQV